MSGFPGKVTAPRRAAGRPQAGRSPRMAPFPLAEVYQLLEPGPVVLLTTAQAGRQNLMTLSWHMAVEFEPPLLACIVSSSNHSHAALCETGECAIAIPDQILARQTVGIGNCSGRERDKFADFGLTAVPGACVMAPLVAECFANLECRVHDTRLAGHYDLFILEVVRAWTDPLQTAPRTLHHHGFGRFVVDGETITLPSEMP